MSCRRTRGQASANYRSARGRLFGWRTEFQKIPHSAHNLYPGRQVSDHAPPYTPNIKRFMTQLLATGLKHNTEAVFTSARFTVGSFEHRALPRLSLAHALGTCTGTEKLKLFERVSYPFYAFQVALQQRVQGKDHIVAQTLELREDKEDFKCSGLSFNSVANISQHSAKADLYTQG